MENLNSKITLINKLYEDEYLPDIKFYDEEDTDKVCQEILHQIAQFKIKEGEFSYNDVFRSEKIGDFDFKERLTLFFSLFENLSEELKINDPLSLQFLKDITERLNLLDVVIPTSFQYNFIPITLLLQWHNKIVKCYLTCREAGIESLDLLSKNPSEDEISEFSELVENNRLINFLRLYKELIDKIRDYALRLQILYIYYIRRMHSIYDKIVRCQDTVSYFNESTDVIIKETDYYINFLKEKGIIEKKWEYSFQNLRLLKDIFIKEYPEKDYYKVDYHFKVEKIGVDADEEDDKPKLSQDVIDKKEIRVFLSSTFSDMQEERDFLIQVFNMLKEEAKDRGIRFSVVDLRWGITPEEAARGSVIDLCLSEIQKSKPFFIGIIGDNYGSVPPEDMIKDKELINKYPWLAEDIKNGLSYTEIEIQSGVLRNPEKINAYFYIKESKGGNKDTKLTNLKQSLENQNRYPVKYYKYSGDVANDIINDFRDLIQEISPEEPHWTPLSQLKWKEDFYYKSLLEFNIPSGIEDKIDSFLKNKYEKILIVRGNEGSGKSTIAANIVNSYKDKMNVLYFFPAACVYQGTLLNILNLWLGNPFFGVREINYSNASNKVLQKLQTVDTEETLIVIDDADTIDFSTLQEEISDWISSIPLNVKVILTAEKLTNLDRVLPRDTEEIKLGDVPMDARREFIEKYLSRVGKKLTEEQMNNLLKSPLLYSPSLLKSFADELAAFGYFEKLDEKILKLSSLTLIGDLYNETFNRLEVDYGYEKVKKISQYLSLSRGEVSLRDIYWGLKEENFLILLSNGTPVFKLNDDTVSFTNEIVKNVAYRRYFEDKQEENLVRTKLLEYLFKKNEREKIYLGFYDLNTDYLYYQPDALSVYDLAYLVAQSSEIKVLANFIENPNFFGILYVTDTKLLERIWELLIEKNYDFDKLIDRMQSHEFYKEIFHLILKEINWIAEKNGQQSLAAKAMKAE